MNSNFNRWMLFGTLTTTTPLQIGSGEHTSRAGLTNEKGEEAKIGAVEVDANGTPIIPGSALKGALHSALRLLTDRVQYSDTFRKMESTFGSPDNEGDLGGKVEFLDSRLDVTSINDINQRFPFLEQYRDVKAGVAIDRNLRTAADQKLYYREFVPAGARFDVAIAARNTEPTEIALVLASLELLNREGATLGGSSSSGYGRLEWSWHKEQSVCVNESSILLWIKNGCPAIGKMPPLPADELSRIGQKVDSFTLELKPRLTELKICIKIDGPFLARKLQPPVQKMSGQPSATPAQNLNGQYLLPAESIRGAIRSQAERIVRTLGYEACDPSSDFACTAVSTPSDLKTRCLVCQMFGAPGFRSRISFSDFLVVSEPVVLRQELLAIDRFTGGGANGKKFSYETLFRPILEGSIRFESLEPWQLGLLAMVLKDLQDGDITLGSGAGRGYGRCVEAAVSVSGRQSLAGQQVLKALATAIAELSRVSESKE